MKKLTVAAFTLALLLISTPYSTLLAVDEDSKVSRKGIESPDYILSMAFFHYNNLEYDKAIELFEKYLELAGENEIALIQMGKIYLDLKKLDQSKIYYERALKQNSKNTDILSALSDIALNENNIDEAIKYLDSITELDPINERALFTLAQIYEQKKDSRKMMVYYRKLALATLKNSANPRLLKRAYNKIARYYSEQQNYSKAMEYYKKIVDLNGQDSNSMFIYGELLKLNGQFAESAKVMIDLLNFNPGNESILESLVESLYITDDYRTRAYLKSYLENANQGKLIYEIIQKQYDNNLGEAKEGFKNILKSNPNRISVHIGVFNCLDLDNKDDLEDAKKEAYSIVILAQKIKAYDIAIKYMGLVFDILEKENKSVNVNSVFLNPSGSEMNPEQEKLINEYTDAFYTHAVSLENSNNIKQATVYFFNSFRYINQLIDIYKKKYKINDQLHYETDLFRNRQFEFSENQEQMTRELKTLLDKKFEIMLSLNWILFKQIKETPYDIEKYITENISINPEDHRGYYLTGLYFHEKSRLQNDVKSLYQKAENNFDLAIKYFEKNSENRLAPATYYFYKGITAEKIGNFSEMEQNLKIAIQENPNNAMFLNYLGYMYSQRNMNLEEAFQYIKGALEDDPENAAYLDTLGWIYYKMNKYEEALGQLLVAKSLSSKNETEDPVISYHIAETYLKLGNEDQAVPFFKSALENLKNSSEPLDKKYIEEKINELSN